jgi:hypothetical protein
MAAIVFTARTSTPWALLPVGEFGCGSATTCWNDGLVFQALLDDIPPVRTPAGRRRAAPRRSMRTRPTTIAAAALPDRRGIKVGVARRGVESSTRLGHYRWKAERSIAWLAGCRRLRIRQDCSSERFFAFAMLACARLGYNRLPEIAHARARSP